VPARPSEDLSIFTDDDLAWVETPVPPSVPARPPTPSRPRPEVRPVRPAPRAPGGALTRVAYAIPLWLLLVVVGALLAGLLALALRDYGPPLGGSEHAQPPAAQPPDESPAPSAAVEKTLRLGDRGEVVRGVQAALNFLGFGSEAPDGLLGGSTSAAVAAFQQSRGLGGDGVVGPATAGALANALAESARAEATTAGRGLTEAVAAGRLSEKSAARHQAVLSDAVSRFERLSPARSAYLAVAMRIVALHAADYDEPRAQTLFGMVEANARYLAGRRLKSPLSDITGKDGVVYRFTRAHGFQFHPLANFAKLNRLVNQERRESVARLSEALLARAVPAGDTLIWEYYFPFGGPSRWTSGFAQAVAAQALARSAALLGDDTLEQRAGAAFRIIPARLASEVAGGLWVREYSFSSNLILNAQLQTLVSLMQYVEISGDAEAAAVVARLDAATRTLLPRFDTGCWSLYLLGGSPAPLHYHTYHVDLLNQLAKRTGAQFWRAYATRWEGYLGTSSSAPACAAP
jgi:D-glucuronyl C5-epimerase C-terminus/Putative peptidoglycan binding domain